LGLSWSPWIRLQGLEWLKSHEVGVMNDVRLSCALHQFALRCMGRDDVADRIRDAALHG